MFRVKTDNHDQIKLFPVENSSAFWDGEKTSVISMKDLVVLAEDGEAEKGILLQ